MDEPLLAFELERGDADGSEAPPCVWQVARLPDEAALARRFGDEWARWYGPELAGAAARIGGLLALHPLSPLSSPSATAQEAGAPALPAAWVMPLVRRRRRQLTIWLPAAGASAPAPMGGRLRLDLQLFWGATSRPGVPAGQVQWQDCALHEPLPGADVAWPRGGAAQLLLARQLRGGVGLLVVRPSWQPAAAEASGLRREP